ncbi:hypothetical protein L2E82_14939 [Cichorium intybus]|uniref:Uncharacterized protein n=1 Tax=Cichorium intybus TaxID=13427 RepID=A0ACB9F2N7_CICIN|nr:hypothetical protein L2E82_14939 [Cichorium intybus]
MANSSSAINTPFFIILLLLWSCTLHVRGCYTSIISFGDSLTDTGNLKQLTSGLNQKPLNFFLPPYGESFFHEPTGRCSNGRLIIDFIAESLNLSYVRPFYGGNDSQMMELGQGVNYAVVGATALDSSFFEARGIHNPTTNTSLGYQVEWFKQWLPSICANVSDCSLVLASSLSIVGEIGGNDYNHALAGGKSIDEVEAYVPFVVEAIISAINELIELGVKTLLVPGNLPIGCSAEYLTMYNGVDKMEHDNLTGCLTQLNKFTEYYNELLVTELNKTRHLHPGANIIYADYYNAAMQFFQSPNKYGAFHYNDSIACGDPSSTVCAQPDTYANWDGLHLTESAYKVISKSLLQGPFTVPQFKSFCPRTILKEMDGLSSYM